MTASSSTSSQTTTMTLSSNTSGCSGDNNDDVFTEIGTHKDLVPERPNTDVHSAFAACTTISRDSPSSPPSHPSFSSSSEEHRVESSHHKRLRASNNKLRCYVAGLGVLLVILVVMLTISMAVLNARHPGFWSHAASVLGSNTASAAAAAAAADGGDAVITSGAASSGTGSLEGGGGTGSLGPAEPRCVSIREHVQRCADDDAAAGGGGGGGAGGGGSGGGCSLDVETALCLLTKTKADLDARTKRLDEEVYRNNRQLEDLIPSRSLVKNVSDAYIRRPSAHLHLYYSHEYREPSDDVFRFEPLKWTSASGLSSLREIDVIIADDAVVSIQVRSRGYYYVYSQVTFNPQGMKWSKSRPLHCLYKNYSRKVRGSSNRNVMMVTYQELTVTDHVTHVQGIFHLKAGDQLTVLAPSALLNTSHTDNTFFGAYRI